MKLPDSIHESAYVFVVYNFNNVFNFAKGVTVT